MTKHDAVHSFIKKKIDDLTEQTLGFNYSSEEMGQIAITTDFSDRVIKKYFKGAEKAYGFTITLIRPYSTDLDSLNLECMNFVQSFMDWIDEQNKKRISLILARVAKSRKWRICKTCLTYLVSIPKKVWHDIRFNVELFILTRRTSNEIK